MYYCSTITGHIFHTSQIGIINDVYGEGVFEAGVENGTFQEIAPPSVIDCIDWSTEATAIIRYREIHEDATISKARKAVARIRRDMEYNRAKVAEE